MAKRIQTINASKRTIFLALSQIFKNRTKGIKLNVFDEQQGIIKGNVSLTLFSWGEKIIINVMPINENACSVNVQSKLYFGIDILGKNKKNINFIFNSLNSYLQRK